MPSDHVDDLAHYRARRDQRASNPDPAAEDPWSAEQRDAIARARESWALSQLGRERHTGRGPTDDAPSDPVDERPSAPRDDD